MSTFHVSVSERDCRTYKSFSSVGHYFSLSMYVQIVDDDDHSYYGKI